MSSQSHESPRQWAIVLGASSGTGAAVARAVARDPGLHVFGVHRGNWALQADEVARAVDAAGGRWEAWLVDASTPEAAQEGARRLLELAGPRSVGLFVHAIAGASVGPLATGERVMSPRQVERTFQRMAHSFLYWSQALHRHDLLAPGSLLLGLSNPMTDVVVRDTALIAATKAALEIYVRHLAFELGPQGHRVNLLKFGFVETPAVRETFPSDALERLRTVVERAIPARRLCHMDEVARIVCFLTGEGGRWFNGATIDFTGAETQALFDVAVYPDPPERKRSR